MEDMSDEAVEDAGSARWPKTLTPLPARLAATHADPRARAARPLPPHVDGCARPSTPAPPACASPLSHSMRFVVTARPLLDPVGFIMGADTTGKSSASESERSSLR